LFNNPSDPAEENYNTCHKATRRIVECAYGILKERFPCLHHLRVEPEFAGMIILACVTLHNIANKDELTYDPVDENDYGGTPATGPEASTDAGKQRVNELLSFFA
jgi:hypothetical protein